MLRMPQIGVSSYVQIPTVGLPEECKCPTHGTRSKFYFNDVMNEAIILIFLLGILSFFFYFLNPSLPVLCDLRKVVQPHFDFLSW